jgi:putative membrane protein
MLAAIFAFLHHVAAFTLASAVVAEFLMLRNEMSLRNARGILRVDLILGIAAATVLTVGVVRVLFFEKGTAYYLSSASFIAKISLFAVVGLLSMIPTREFLSWRIAIRQGQSPAVRPEKIRLARRVIHWELAGLLLIIFCAALMAKGIG